MPAGATEVTYAVIATSESDRIVARSRAASVRIPSDRPIDVRPVDRVASDAGPAVAPADAAPGAGVPGDVAPPSTPPASVDATTDVSAQAPAAFVRLVTLRARLLRLVRELAAF